MPILRRLRVTAAKIESTIGTAESLSATDAAMNIYNAVINPTISKEQREGQGGFGYLSSIDGPRAGVATFRTYLEWDGTATEPAWADTFLPACGWVKSGQVYTPRTEAPGSNVKTLTIGVYNQGKRRRLAGAVGNFVVTLPTGRTGYIDWTFTGLYLGEDATAILTPTYPTAKPIKFLGEASWNSIAFCPASTTINAGNEVFLRECPNTATGYESAIITNRRPTITSDPESVSIATQDRWSHMLDDAEYELNIECNGPTTSVLAFNAPKAQLVGLSEGDRNNLVTDQTEWQCNKNGATSDQELSITFTAAT